MYDYIQYFRNRRKRAVALSKEEEPASLDATSMLLGEPWVFKWTWWKHSICDTHFPHPSPRYLQIVGASKPRLSYQWEKRWDHSTYSSRNKTRLRGFRKMVEVLGQGRRHCGKYLAWLSDQKLVSKISKPCIMLELIFRLVAATARKINQPDSLE